MLEGYRSLVTRIEAIVKASKVPEDSVHSKNTLKWVLKLKPDADDALKIAALGHDIERAIEDEKVNRRDFESYDEFKNAHAINSAKILKRIMISCKVVNKDLIKDVCFLVVNHETGGDTRANLLKEADGISFFDVNLPYYFVRNGEEETKKRVLWGYNRLSNNSKKIISKFKYENKELDSFVKKVYKDYF